MSYSYYRKCAVCGVSQNSQKTNIHLKYHRFPRLSVNKQNINQLRQWAAYCYPGQDFSENDLINFSKNNKVLCQRHFDETCYTGSDRKRLIKHAVPNKNVVEQVAGSPGTRLNVEHANITLPPSPKIFIEIHSEPGTQTPKPPTTEILEIEKPPEPEIQLPSPASPFVKIRPEPGTKNKNQRPPDILRSLNISSISQLNSRERQLYNICRYLLKTVSKLKRKLKENRNI